MEDNKDSSDKQTHRRRSEIPKTADAIETLRSGETTTRHVPQEIIEQILVRLPVNSLLRFKCVAKSWLALISSPEFIKTQVTYSTILDPTLSNYRLVLSIWYEGRSRDNESSCLDSYVLRDFWTNRVGDADCPNNQTEQLFCINGSCNGLLCVSTVGNWSLKDVFLWNPCLRMSKKLPPPRAVAESNEIGAASSYDIFYDERNDDYKVVGFIAPVHDEHFLEPAVEIYSSKSDSWKRVDGFKGSPYSSVVCANGKVHFVGSCGNGGDLSIVSLDLENEVYGTVELLKGEQKRFFSLSIGVIKGCISALYCDKDYADVWILKEYGVKESWTKLVRIPCVDGDDNNAPRHLSFLWNGKYLLSCRSHLVVYDPEDGSSVYTSVSKGNLGCIASEGIYVESLVPVPQMKL